jgi:hypothetical protein
MSGFLHQLAFRSLGLAPQIKSRAALPYATPTADFSVAESGKFESPPATPAIERQGYEAPVPDARPVGRTAESLMPAPIVAEKPVRSASIARQAPRPEADAANQPPRLSRSPSPEETPQEIAHRSQPPKPSVAAIANPVMAAMTPIQRHHEPVTESAPPGDEVRGPSPDLETLVSRLLGDRQNTPGTTAETALTPPAAMPRPSGRRPEATSTIRSQASRERPTKAAEIDTAPEVHITIGRLEVNPPSRPTPAIQPPRPRGPAPLSLNDYLARRGGRS